MLVPQYMFSKTNAMELIPEVSPNSNSSEITKELKIHLLKNRDTLYNKIRPLLFEIALQKATLNPNIALNDNYYTNYNALAKLIYSEKEDIINFISSLFKTNSIDFSIYNI